MISYNYSINKSVLLADVVGLGKTIQTIGFIHQLYYYYNNNSKVVLIIAPLSVVSMWYGEI